MRARAKLVKINALRPKEIIQRESRAYFSANLPDVPAIFFTLRYTIQSTTFVFNSFLLLSHSDRSNIRTDGEDYRFRLYF